MCASRLEFTEMCEPSVSLHSIYLCAFEFSFAAALHTVFRLSSFQLPRSSKTEEIASGGGRCFDSFKFAYEQLCAFKRLRNMGELVDG